MSIQQQRLYLNSFSKFLSFVPILLCELFFVVPKTISLSLINNYLKNKHKKKKLKKKLFFKIKKIKSTN